MKIKTSELTGSALDWAVAKSSGIKFFSMDDDWPGNSVVNNTSENEPIIIFDLTKRLWIEHQGRTAAYSPSTNFDLLNEFIKTLIFWFQSAGRGRWKACCKGNGYIFGGTPEIAICRAVVAHKLGDEVEVPDELVSQPGKSHG